MSIIEIATAATSGAAMAPSKILLSVPNLMSTNANSPTWASANASSQRAGRSRSNSRPAINRTISFKTMAPATMPMIVPGSRAISGKSICAPTEMKNNPSRRPLNGSMSASSSWRYSLSASTTPATKVPSAGDSPTCSMSSAMATTISSAAAMNDSRRRTVARNWNAGRITKRPAATTPPTAPITRSAVIHAGRPSSAPAVTSATPSSGKIARIGMTAMSWNSSTANAACPPPVFSWPRSARVDSTIAVDDIAMMKPIAMAARHGTPSARAALPTRTAVAATCKPPRPRIERRSRHKSDGCSSRPTTNSISTTPNSAKCMTWAPSPPIAPSTLGPTSTPATR